MTNTAPPPLPAGCTAMPGAGVDPRSGLPMRVRHDASGIVLALVPAGSFRMGASATDPDRRPGAVQRAVTLPSDFYLGETEVTVAQFRAFVAAIGYRTDAERGKPEGGHGRGAFSALPHGDRTWSEAASWKDAFDLLGDIERRDHLPVVQVSWNDAARFCAHHGFVLPSDAQWEYACRAGSDATFPWGDDPAGGAGFANVQDAAGKRRFPGFNIPFPFDDGVAVLAPAGSYAANAFGLRDMIGNVEEWCADNHDGSTRPEAARVLRGGSWLGGPFNCRSAARAGMLPSSRRDFIGFRVALTLR